MSWVKPKNLDFINVETDSFQTVQALDAIEGVSSFDLILNDVKDLLSMMSHNCISFVKWSANQIVLELAQESISRSDCREWYFIHQLLFVI